MDRRQFLRNGLIGAAGVGVLSTVEMTAAYAAEPGVGPYGSLEGINPDANGIILPEGFTLAPKDPAWSVFIFLILYIYI